MQRWHQNRNATKPERRWNLQIYIEVRTMCRTMCGQKYWTFAEIIQNNQKCTGKGSTAYTKLIGCAQYNSYSVSINSNKSEIPIGEWFPSGNSAVASRSDTNIPKLHQLHSNQVSATLADFPLLATVLFSHLGYIYYIWYNVQLDSIKFESNYYYIMLYSYISKRCPINKTLDEMLSNKRKR